MPACQSSTLRVISVTNKLVAIKFKLRVNWYAWTWLCCCDLLIGVAIAVTWFTLPREEGKKIDTCIEFCIGRLGIRMTPSPSLPLPSSLESTPAHTKAVKLHVFLSMESRLWELEAQSFRVLEGRRSGVSTVAFSRNDSTLVSRDYVGKFFFGMSKVIDASENCLMRALK